MTKTVKIPEPAIYPFDVERRPGMILVDPWGQVERIEVDGTRTLLRGGCCGRPLEEFRRAA